MPHTTTKTKRTKRPDFRPNGKRRLKAQQAKTEKERKERVTANELKGKVFTVPRHEKLPPLPTEDSAAARSHARGGSRKPQSNDESFVRFRALSKLLRQIVDLDEKQKRGVKLNEAQLEKLGRFDEVAGELEEMQRELDEQQEEEEGEESGSGEDEA